MTMHNVNVIRGRGLVNCAAVQLLHLFYIIRATKHSPHIHTHTQIHTHTHMHSKLTQSIRGEWCVLVLIVRTLGEDYDIMMMIVSVIFRSGAGFFIVYAHKCSPFLKCSKW